MVSQRKPPMDPFDSNDDGYDYLIRTVVITIAAALTFYAVWFLV